MESPYSYTKSDDENIKNSGRTDYLAHMGQIIGEKTVRHEQKKKKMAVSVLAFMQEFNNLVAWDLLTLKC